MDYSSIGGISPAVKQFLSDSDIAAKPPDTGILDRSVGYLLGAVPQTAEDITSAVGNISGQFDGHFISPQAQSMLKPATTTVGRITDFAGAALPAIGTFLAGEGPVGAISELTGLTKAAPLIAGATKSAAGFGFQGASQDATEGAIQAGVGGTIGLLHGLSPLARLPAAIGLAYFSKQISDARNPDNPMNGMVQGAMNFAATMLHTQVGKARPLVDPTNFATVANPTIFDRPPDNPIGALSDVRTGLQTGELPVQPTPIQVVPEAAPTVIDPAKIAAIRTSLQGIPELPTEPFTGEPIQPAVNTPEVPPPLVETSVQRAIRFRAEQEAQATSDPIKTMVRPVLDDQAGSINGIGAELPPQETAPLTGSWKDQLTTAAVRLGIGGAAGAVLAGPDASTEDRIKLGLIGASAAVAAPYTLDAATQLKLALKGRTGEVGGIANTEQGSVPAGGGKQIGTSNLDATVEKNISDAKMMQPNDPQGFLQKMSDMARKNGKEDVAANFDKAVTHLQSLQSPTVLESEQAGKIIITPSAKNPGAWQATHFRDDEPQGDAQFKTKEDALASAQGQEVLHLNERSRQPIGTTSFKVPNTSQSGSIIPELNTYLTRAMVGGVVGGMIGGHYDNNGDTSGFVTGGLLGAATAAFGPEIALAGIKKLGKAKLTEPTKGLSWAGDLNKTFSGKIEQAGGDVIHGSTLMADRLIAYLDNSLNLTLPVAISRTLRVAEGTATQLLDTMDSSMRKISVLFKAPEELKQAANTYLDDGSDAAKQTFLQSLQSDDHKLYAQYIVAARESINGLQRMVMSGIGDPAKAQMISDSIGKYLTKSYKLFTRDNWSPSPESVNNLAQQLMQEKRWQSASEGEVRDYLYSYIREVNTNKGMYKGAGTREGQSIDQTVMKARKDLTPEWRSFLGEVTNPAERIAQTVYRLRPMAVASKYLGDLAMTVKDGDMPHYFPDRGSLEAFKQQKLQSLQNTSVSPSEQAATKLQLAKLDNFVPVESIPKYGSLRGGLVSRNVWNTLSTFDSNTTIGSHPLMRSLAGLNMASKLSNTALNPISFTRNVFQAPMMMLLGRANPNDVFEGIKILHDADHPLRAEVIRQGIGSVDQLKQEIFRDFDAATEGKYNFTNLDSTNLSIGRLDADAARKAFGKFSNKYLDIYRTPDNAVRIGTYLSAKRRIAEALGKVMDDPDVISKATDFTNRYTMDYGSVAPLIKGARQIPGVNLYISYISEMTRIAKNVMMDMVHGGDGITTHDRMYAAMPIAMLGALPEILNSNAEANLSPKDQQDWEKVKQLMPDYSRTRYRANIVRNADGNFTYTDFTPLIPTDFLHQTARALANHDLWALAAVNPVMSLDNSPALNILMEQTTGKDVHTQRDFRGFSDRVASVAKEILPPWLSIGREGRKFEQAYTPTDTGELGLTNLRTGQRLTPSDFWLPYETALRSGSYNLSALEQSATQQVKQDIANNSAYLNDILKSDAAPEIKQREMLKFRVIQQQLIGAWQEKLGLSQSASAPNQQAVALTTK